MASLADGFIALPGGWGTLDEIAEVTTWTQRLDLQRIYQGSPRFVGS